MSTEKVKLADQWSNQRVMITGASGVIGCALKDELIQNGYSNVVTLASSDADLRNEEQAARIMEVHRPSLVFHLAARVAGIMGNMTNRAGAFLDNVRINTNVIEAARAAGVRKIVAMGTTAIYSDLAPLPIREDDVWIGPPHHSEAPYAHAKRAMLAQLQAYAEQYDLEFAFCVSTNLFGPGDKFDEEHGHVLPSLISKFYRAKLIGSPVQVWGSGQAQRDFLYSKDAARALRVIANSGTGVINLATGSSILIRTCVNAIADAIEFKNEILWDKTKPDGQLQRSYDVSRLKALGFSPAYTLERALLETYQWFEANVHQVRR